MRKRTVLVIAASLCTACTAQLEAAPAKAGREVAAQPAPAATRGSAAKRLAKAVDMLGRGDATGAAKLLNAITKERPVPGVTDEALFRLALLSMKPGAEGGSSVQELRLLKRLKKEYPASPWTVQAEPLLELIGVDEELRRQNRTLKAANQSLTAEKDSLKKKVEELEGKVQQLNKNLEQLKRIDLELENKTR